MKPVKKLNKTLQDPDIFLKILGMAYFLIELSGTQIFIIVTFFQYLNSPNINPQHLTHLKLSIARKDTRRLVTHEATFGIKIFVHLRKS